MNAPQFGSNFVDSPIECETFAKMGMKLILPTLGPMGPKPNGFEMNVGFWFQRFTVPTLNLMPHCSYGIGVVG